MGNYNNLLALLSNDLQPFIILTTVTVIFLSILIFLVTRDWEKPVATDLSKEKETKPQKKELFSYEKLLLQYETKQDEREKFKERLSTVDSIPFNEKYSQLTMPAARSLNDSLNIRREDSSVIFNDWIKDTTNILNSSKSLSDLLILHPPSDIFYAKLLTCFEWRFKRLKILMRDSFKCKSCGKIDEYNHVHHTRYIKHKLPWDIDDFRLETLCRGCHYSLHQNTSIPVFEDINGDFIEICREHPSCTRCGGIGYIAQYSHVEDGICFKCRGRTINSNVFYKVLSGLYERLNTYDENSKRDEYKLYLYGLSELDFRNKVPISKDLRVYVPEPKNKHVWEDEEDYDDMPF